MTQEVSLTYFLIPTYLSISNTHRTCGRLFTYSYMYIHVCVTDVAAGHLFLIKFQCLNNAGMLSMLLLTV